MSPGTLTFPDSEPERRAKEQQYVHWLGKGEGHQQEWAFRMYNFDDPKDDPIGYDNRSNRTSFYLFNLTGGLGAGSYVQEPVTAGTWYHYVAVADMRTDTITLYKNGVLKKQVPFMNSVYNIHPQNGTSPVRVGTLDPGARDTSFFKGAIDNISIYNRALSVAEINQLFNDPTP
jgi:hypothetical protein